MTSTKKKSAEKMPAKKAGKRVPQHNEPKAKMPKHEGVPKAMRRPMPTGADAKYARGGHNISTGKMAGKKRTK